MFFHFFESKILRGLHDAKEKEPSIRLSISWLQTRIVLRPHPQVGSTIVITLRGQKKSRCSDCAVLNSHVDTAIEELGLDWETVKILDKLFINEQSCLAGSAEPTVIGKRHKYRIVVSNLPARRPIWFGGTDHSEARFDAFFTWLGPEKSCRIRLALMDIWKAFRKRRTARRLSRQSATQHRLPTQRVIPPRIRTIELQAYGFQDQEYFRLKILTCMPPRLKILTYMLPKLPICPTRNPGRPKHFLYTLLPGEACPLRYNRVEKSP